MLLGMSVHVGSRSVFYVESFSREFRELHHVDGLEVIIGLILLKRLKAREESIQDRVPHPQVSLRTTGHRRPVTHYWLLRYWSTV